MNALIQFHKVAAIAIPLWLMFQMVLVYMINMAALCRLMLYVKSIKRETGVSQLEVIEAAIQSND